MVAVMVFVVLFFAFGLGIVGVALTIQSCVDRSLLMFLAGVAAMAIGLGAGIPIAVNHHGQRTAEHEAQIAARNDDREQVLARALDTAVKRQQEIYKMIGDYSDSPRDTLTARLRQQLEPLGAQLMLDRSTLDGSLLIAVRAPATAELPVAERRQLLQLPAQ